MSSFTKEEGQIRRLMKEGRWDEALLVCRRAVDELHERPSWRLRKVLEHVKLDIHQLRAEDTGSSLWLMGEMYCYGWGGVLSLH